MILCVKSDIQNKLSIYLSQFPLYNLAIQKNVRHSTRNKLSGAPYKALILDSIIQMKKERFFGPHEHTKQHPDAKLSPGGSIHANHQVHIEDDAEGGDEGDQWDLPNNY